MAKNFNPAALPEHCYAVLPSSGQLIEVRRGEKGYYPCAYSTGDREYNKILANQFNTHEGISKAQAAAMLAGSMFGWNVPAADPACYDTEGIPIQPGEKKAPTRSPEYQYEQAKLIRQHYQPGSKVVLDETNNEDIDKEATIDPEKTASAKTNMGAMATILILALGGVAAYYYFKIYKPKKEEDEDDQPEGLETGGLEEVPDEEESEDEDFEENEK